MAKSYLERKAATGVSGSGTNTIKKVPAKTKATKKGASSGMGYTATSTNSKTGEKITKSGTLKSISKNEFMGSGKMLKKATPRAATATGSAPTMATGNRSTVKKKTY